MIYLKNKNRSWKPNGPQRIDWSNPLTRGLAQCYLIHHAGPPVCLVRPDLYSLDYSGAPAWEPKSGGQGLFFDGSDDIAKVTISSGTAIEGQRFVSMGVVASWGTDAGTDRRMIGFRDESGTNPTWGIGTDDTAVQRFRGWFRTSAPGFVELQSSTNAFGDNMPHAAIVTTDAEYSAAPANANKLYVNGKLEAQANSNSAWQASNMLFDNFSLGGLYRAGAGSSLFKGTVYFAAVWVGRPLTTDELEAWSCEPYQILKPFVKRIYYVPVNAEVTVTVNSASHTHNANNTTLNQEHILVIANATHAHVAENSTLLQNHELAQSSTAHEHTSENSTLNQDHILTVASTAHEHVASNSTLGQNHTLSVENTIHTHISNNVTLLQNHALTITEAAHVHTAENATLFPAGEISVQSVTHEHTSANVILNQNHIITVVNAAHAHICTNVAFTQNHSLDITNATNEQTADNSTLAQNHILVNTSASHEHSADNIVLTVAGELNIFDGLHAQNAENSVLNQNHNLIITAAAHEHNVGTVTLIPGIVISSNIHGLFSDSITITQNHALSTFDGVHTHVASNVVLIAAGLEPSTRRTRKSSTANRTAAAASSRNRQTTV